MKKKYLAKFNYKKRKYSLCIFYSKISYRLRKQTPLLLFHIPLLIFFSLKCSGAFLFPSGTYMPKKYIAALQINSDTTQVNYLLMPFQAIKIKNGKVYCQCYNDEYYPTKYLMKKNNKEIELLTVPKFINSDDSLKWKSAKYFLVKDKNSIFLVVKHLNIVDSILFVNTLFDTVQIVSSDLVSYQCRLISKSFILETDKSEKNNNVKILSNGKVLNSDLLNYLVLTGTGGGSLRREQIGTVIPDKLEMTKIYYPDLGIIIGGEIRMSNSQSKIEVIIRFKDKKFFIYETEPIAVYGFKLKRLIFTLIESN